MKDLDAVKMPGSPCPCCKKVLDAATPAFENQITPKTGDLSVCINCGTPLQFGPNLELLELTEQDMDQLPMLIRSQMQRAVATVKRVISKPKLDFT